MHMNNPAGAEQLGDVAKALFTASLALTTLFLWELWLKPMRLKLNLALVLIAELELNLEEIAYYRVCREEDIENQLVSLLLPRSSFLASQGTLGELSATDLRSVIRFYAITSKLESTQAALQKTEEAKLAATDPVDKAVLSAAVQSGVRAIGHLLDDAWEVGNEARLALDRAARRSSPNDLPRVILAADLIGAARKRRARFGDA